MDRLRRSAEEVMARHPAPALPLEELNALVAREAPEEPAAPTALLDAIRGGSSALRVVEGDRERIGAVGPRRWVVAPPGGRRGGGSGSSLEARLRETVRALGEAVEPGSTLALARWARLLYEGEKVRAVIARGDPPRRLRPLSARRGPR